MRRALLLMAVLVASCKHYDADDAAHATSRPVEVRCVKPAKATIAETIALRGRIEPPPGGDLPVASQVAGRIVSVAVREGDRITAGALVATIDDTPTRDALRQADAALAQARAQEANASLAYDRTKALVDRGIAAKQELEDATAKETAAREGVAAAKAAADLARTTLGRVQVRSGIGGVVTRIFRGPGALVDGTAATPVLQLASTSAAELVCDVTQRELLALAEGQAAKGALAGAGGPAIAGAVRARPRSLDPTTGLGVVRIALTSPESEALPVGAFARAIVTTGAREAPIVVPAAALRGAAADGAEVALCAGDKAAIKVVKVGWRDDTRVEIEGGLAATDAVAIDHVLALDDGTAIKVVP